MALTKPPVGTKVRLVASGFDDAIPSLTKNDGNIGTVVEPDWGYSASVLAMYLDVNFDNWIHTNGEVGNCLFLFEDDSEFEVLG